MICGSCSRRTLGLFIRSLAPENRFPLLAPYPFRIAPKSRPLSVSRSLCQTDPVSADLQTPKTSAVEPVDAAESPLQKPPSPKSPENPASPLPPNGTPRTTKKKTKEEWRIHKEALKKNKPASSAPAQNEIQKTIKKKTKEEWRLHKEALKNKFGDQGWQPRKKLSPDAMEGIRHLHRSEPDKFTTPVLSEYFKVSPEAIRRILKSKWQPTDEEQEERLRRWDKRGERIWANLVELGVKPPKKWREMGVGRAPPGEVPKWKGLRRNTVKVQPSISDDIIPIVDSISEQKSMRWQDTPLAKRIV